MCRLYSPMMPRGALLLALCLTGCARPAAPREPAPRPDGTVESLRLLLRTERSDYFGLTYWSDGLRVEGFLGRPRAGAPHPAVIFNRAGHLDLNALRGPELVPLVERGFVAIASQYRGNTGGEGREEYGGAEVNDVLNLVLLLRGLPEVDPDRIGMMGWSRGGTMTYLALKQETLRGTRDIKAAVAIGAPADFSRGFWARLQIAVVNLTRSAPRSGRFPDPVRERSAVFWPELIGAPLLILHGEADGMVPVEDARRLALLLRDAGKSVRLVTYPADNHALAAHDAGYPEAVAWFERHLGKAGEDHSFEEYREDVRRAFQEWAR